MTTYYCPKCGHYATVNGMGEYKCQECGAVMVTILWSGIAKCYKQPHPDFDHIEGFYRDQYYIFDLVHDGQRSWYRLYIAPTSDKPDYNLEAGKFRKFFTRVEDIDELDKLEDDVLFPGKCIQMPIEGGWMINAISRQFIHAYRAKYGVAWVGIINRSGTSRKWIEKYDGGMVYNFAYSFVLPQNDAELVQLLQDREDAPYTGTSADWERLKLIEKRIYDIGGRYLHWV